MRVRAQEEERGMIARAVDMIFEEVTALRSKGWTYDISVPSLSQTHQCVYVCVHARVRVRACVRACVCERESECSSSRVLCLQLTCGGIVRGRREGGGGRERHALHSDNTVLQIVL